jgi:hypothetical protein
VDLAWSRFRSARASQIHWTLWHWLPWSSLVVPIQSSEFVMVGLGVHNDSPPNALQPKLVDAVHLLWSFNRTLGLAWYGCWLLRRSHNQD